MKRDSLLTLYTLLIAICIVGPEKLHAQENTWWIGAFGGVDRGKFSYSSGSALYESREPQSDWKSRAYFGIESDIWFSEHWAIMARATYVQKGTYEYNELTVNVDGKNVDINAIEDVTLTYFQMPVGVRAIFGRGSLKTSFFFGPTTDILLSAKDHITFDGYGDTTVTLTNVEDIGLGIILGTSIGYVFESGISVFAEATYDYSITNVFPDEAYVPSASTRDYRFGLSLFYQIR
jgi:hypothetical protein